jgi:N-acetylneuraminate synthase
MGTRFVAEIGSNHNGDLARALALVEAAAKAGFWAVKSQQYDPETLFSAEALRHSPSLKERPRFQPAWHEHLAKEAHNHGLQYGISVFDPGSVEVAAQYADFLKVSSYEILNLGLIRRASAATSRFVFSSGMASMEECKTALDACALMCSKTVLHCVSAYPASWKACNLAAIDNMQKQLCVPIGWSDHTRDEEVVLRAVRRWRVTMVEVHLDLEDQAGAEGLAHCWTPTMIAPVIEQADVMPAEMERWTAMDGHGLKDPAKCELEERRWRADPYDGQRPRIEHRSYLRR